jgi:hypothetical protein
MWDETAGNMDLIWVCDEAEYFCQKGWTAGSAGLAKLPVGQISQRVRRTAFVESAGLATKRSRRKQSMTRAVSA